MLVDTSYYYKNRETHLLSNNYKTKISSGGGASLTIAAESDFVVIAHVSAGLVQVQTLEPPGEGAGDALPCIVCHGPRSDHAALDAVHLGLGAERVRPAQAVDRLDVSTVGRCRRVGTHPRRPPRRRAGRGVRSVHGGGHWWPGRRRRGGLGHVGCGPCTEAHPFQLATVAGTVVKKKERKGKEMLYLTTHSTHFIHGYMASDIW